MGLWAMTPTQTQNKPLNGTRIKAKSTGICQNRGNKNKA